MASASLLFHFFLTLYNISIFTMEEEEDIALLLFGGWKLFHCLLIVESYSNMILVDA